MSSFRTWTCDACARQVRSEEAVNWIRIERQGADAYAFGERYPDGDFCNELCAENHLASRRLAKVSV